MPRSGRLELVLHISIAGRGPLYGLTYVCSSDMIQPLPEDAGYVFSAGKDKSVKIRVGERCY